MTKSKIFITALAIFTLGFGLMNTEVLAAQVVKTVRAIQYKMTYKDVSSGDTIISMSRFENDEVVCYVARLPTIEGGVGNQCFAKASSTLK